MEIERDNENGDLLIVADENDRDELRELAVDYTPQFGSQALLDSHEAMFNFIPVSDLGFEWVDPAEIGALTSAPILSDGEHFYGFMDYQVTSVCRELRDNGVARFQHGCEH